MQVGCKNRDIRPIPGFISETLQDRVIVTVERQIRTRMTFIKCCYFQWQWTTTNPDFKNIIRRWMSRKRYKIET